MSMQEMTAVITRFQAAIDALAALGARLGMGEGDTMAPEIRTALDDVLAASGVDGVDGLEPQQRAMMAGLVRTMFAQSADLLGCPIRDAGRTAARCRLQGRALAGQDVAGPVRLRDRPQGLRPHPSAPGRNHHGRDSRARLAAG